MNKTPRHLTQIKKERKGKEIIISKREYAILPQQKSHTQILHVHASDSLHTFLSKVAYMFQRNIKYPA